MKCGYHRLLPDGGVACSHKQVYGFGATNRVPAAACESCRFRSADVVEANEREQPTGLSTPDCDNCLAPPADCWKGKEYGCERDRQAARRAFLKSGRCPLTTPTGPLADPPESDLPVPDTIDVVYPLSKESRWQDNELRYSLRSLERNLVGLGRIFIVGHKPAWLTNVIHVPAADANPHNKDANIIDKLLLACHAGVSDRFLFCSDDQLLLVPTNAADLRPYHIGCLKKKPPQFWGGGRWKRGLRRTYDLLLARRVQTFHYDSHIPQPMDRQQFAEIMGGIDYYAGDGYTVNTLFFNLALKHHKRLPSIKACFERPVIDSGEVRHRIAGKTFLGYNEGGLTPALKVTLAELFPVPSRFER